MHVTSRIWSAQGPGMSWVRCRMSDRCGWWVGGEWGWGVGGVGHGWLWPAISNHGGSWLFMARHEQPPSQSGQNQTQAFKGSGRDAMRCSEILRDRHLVFPPQCVGPFSPSMAHSKRIEKRQTSQSGCTSCERTSS